VTFKQRFEKMSGPDFAVALAEVGLSPTEFAALWGTDQDRVLSWFDDAEERGVPFPMWWILELLRISGNISLAHQVAQQHIEARKPETTVVYRKRR
jgi:hypothetical protein